MIPFHNGSATLNIDQQLGAGGQRESGKLSRIINHSETAAHVLRIPFTINTFLLSLHYPQISSFFILPYLQRNTVESPLK